MFGVYKFSFFKIFYDQLKGGGDRVRPRVIDILGLPNAGKTNLLRFLERYFNTNNFNVGFIQDQIRASLISNELNRNLWAIGRIHTMLLEAKEQPLNLIIIERGAGAVYASLDFLLKKGNLNVKERKKAESGKRQALDTLQQEENFFIFINVSRDIISKRDEENGRRIPGKIINPNSLDEFEKSYKELRDKILPKCRTKIINGNLDIKKDWRNINKCRKNTVKRLISLIPSTEEIN